MYDLTERYVLKSGCAFLSNNLSILWHGAKSVTYVAVIGTDCAEVLTLNDKMELLASDLIPLSDSSKHNDDAAKRTHSFAMQASVCLPANRNYPVLVVLTTKNMKIFDVRTKKLLHTFASSSEKQNVAPSFSPLSPFTRGITCIENSIVAGTNTGELMLICSNNETTFQQKKNLKEHEASIIDMATCCFDLLTVTGDVAGNLVVWSKNMKGVVRKISTSQQMSVLNILRKQVFCGTYMGQVLVYAISTGGLMAEINAHSRQINSIAVATESAYILTAGEDTYLRAWKLYSRNPEQYRIEHRWSHKLENCLLVGAKFCTMRGSSFMASQFDGNEIFSFKIAGRPKPAEVQPNTNSEAPEKEMPAS